MFYPIEPQEHHLYPSIINQFLEELQAASMLEVPQDTRQATFLLLTEDIHGVSGGMLLVKEPIKSLPPHIRSYCPHLQEIWKGIISFQMPEALPGRDFEKISKALYKTLYEDLVVFCIKEDAPYLWLSMPLIEHLSIEVWGQWPSLLGIKSTRSDKVFHKIFRLVEPFQEAESIGKFCKNLPGRMESSSVFPLLSAQNCNKIVTIQEKIKPIFTP